MLVRIGAQFGAHRNVFVCLKTRPPNVTNMLLIKNWSILIISVSENFLEESFSTKK
jgi:hypothetical protein